MLWHENIKYIPGVFELSFKWRHNVCLIIPLRLHRGNIKKKKNFVAILKPNSIVQSLLSNHHKQNWMLNFMRCLQAKKKKQTFLKNLLWKRESLYLKTAHSMEDKVHLHSKVKHYVYSSQVSISGKVRID